MNSGESLWRWLVHSSWELSVLILMVLVTQALMGRRLAPRWRHALWLVVLLRSLLPTQPASSLSVFNWVHLPRSAGYGSLKPARERAPVLPPGLAESISAPSSVATAARPLSDLPLQNASFHPEEANAAAGEFHLFEDLRRPSLIEVLLVVWLSGATWFSLHLLVQHRRFRRRLRSARKIEHGLAAAVYDRCCASKRLSRRPPLWSTDAVSSPALYGLWRPRLLLPREVEGLFGAKELQHIFRHELAHLARWDLLWSGLGAVIRVVHWYNPLVWVAIRRMRVDGELACDAEVLHGAPEAERTAYGRTIVKLLEHSIPCPAAPGVVTLVGGKRALRERITMIRWFRATRAVSAISVATLMAVAAVGLTDEVGAVRAAKEPAGVGSAPQKLFRLQVVAAEDDRPLPAGKVHEVLFLRFAPDGVIQTNLTFSEGELGLDLGENPMALMLTVMADGRVPKILSWRPQQEDPIPTGYTVRLESGITVGGVVQDESGRPVSGVTIRMYHPGLSDYADRETPRERLGLGWEELHVERTDASGHWSCTHWPAGYSEVGFSFRHPDFQDGSAGVEGSPFANETVFTLESLKNRTARVVMRKGLVLSGVVTDVEGQPIAGATAALGAFHEGSLKAVTGSDGTFNIANAAAREQWLTVTANGWAPERRTTVVTPGMEPLRVQLAKGGVLRGVLKDPAGRPVAGAMVALQAWRGNNSLEWRVTSDADGGFIWDSAPLDEAEYFVGTVGYVFVRELMLVADGSLHEIVLKPSPKVAGKVVDRSTGTPISSFRVVPGYDRERWYAGSTVRATNGSYEIQLEEPSTRYAVRIEADGYAPAVSPWFEPGSEPREFDAELDRAGTISGRVLLPDGKPAAGAQVAWCTKNQGLGLGRGRLVQHGPAAIPAVGQDGSFELVPDPEAVFLVAIHSQGIARLPIETLASHGDIRLEAFGTIEGAVILRGKPATGERVTLLDLYSRPDRREPYLDLNSFSAKVDEEGRFRLESVPPGEWALYLWPKQNGIPFSHKTVVVVPAGTTVQAGIRSQGRPVVGRVQVRDQESVIDWKTQAGPMSQLRTPMPRPKVPAFRDEAEQQAWSKEYYTSETYRQVQREARSYALEFDADGRFRADDVPPGEYELNLTVQEPAPNGLGMGKQLGSTQVTVTVPEFSGEWSEDPVDTGTQEITLRQSLKPGKMAPGFTVTTLDGRELRLDQLRGKFVLLDFWATWCGPCVAEQPNLRATWESFGEDPRFAMVGLSLDNELEPLQAFVKKHEVPWTQAWLGRWDSTRLPSDYGVYGIPAIFLLDPEGKVLAADLRGEGIKAAVARALAAGPLPK